VAAFCLDIHARYQCRHAGACCQNWSVPAEPHVVEIVNARQLKPRGDGGALFVASADPHETHGRIARDDRGDCVFFDRDAGRLCVIHRDAGVEALPSACRHFPRKVLNDARGTLISLSHFCPTAAATLLTPARLATVHARPPLRLAPPMEGLDASDALPPLLRPGLLCDIHGYDAWERAGVATFARDDLAYDACVDMVAAATELIRNWQPGDGTLLDRVSVAFRSGRPENGADSGSQRRAIEAVATLTAGRVGDDVAPIESFDEKWQRHIGGQVGRFDRGMRNYLAARLFANWIAYQGRGLRSIVEWLRTCAAVVRHQLLQRAIDAGSPPDIDDFIEAVRSADLLLLHVVDTAAFANHVAPIEGLDPL
jgi:Fe-S-cluster containining protein